MNYYIGTSGYGYKEWQGNFYPEKISAGKRLSFYASRLMTVEINNTFYRMPTINVVEAWADQVPAGFIFAVKAPQMITHIKRLQNVSKEARYFFTIVSVLGKKLGPVLFQFPASFRQDIPLLEKFIGHIPPKIACAFDFRSTTWLNKETYDLLRKRNFSLCLEDTDEKPVTELISTATWGYLRLRRTDYTDRQLAQWVKKVGTQKWEKVFVFFKHDDDEAARAPALAAGFSELCRKFEQSK
ncbi:MAG: DUF72 domain-containing protein [Candidatus Margulisiibacteriota bacterium]|jgi:uncharacterized protein YecE (DUF72 family)